MPDVQLNGIEFAIKSDTTSAVVSIDRLRQALSKLQKIHINDLGLKSASREIRRFANSIGSIQTQKLDALSKSLRGLSSFGNAFSKIGENPEKLATGLATMTIYLREISTIDFTNLQTAAESINQIAASANKIGKQAADGAKETGKGIKFVANEAKKASSPLSNFVASLKRIAFYRILRSVIKSITQAFQEGLKNAYEFSKLTGDKAGLANALDTLATKSLTMKNQLGAAFGGLLTAITPIVVQIIGLVTKLAEAISRLMAILGGSDTYLRAKDVWTEWGDAAASAGGAAKKALEYLAPFDELNVLPDPKSGGGGGADASNIGDMFEYVNVNDGLGFGDLLIGWYDKIAEFFEGQNWFELADKAWQGLKDAFSDNGKATEVVNSLFEALGAGIGGATAFIGKFAADALSELAASFKRNLQDYNGDGKISVVEFLGALLTTGLEAYSTIETWVKDNIVDPFFDGVAKSWGLSGHKELYDAIINFGIDIVNEFTQNVINPLIETWNGWVDSLPDWLKNRIKDWFGVDDLKIPLVGEIEHVNTAGITASELIIKNMTAGLTAALDKIPSGKKNISGMTADFGKSKNSLTSDQSSFPVTGNFTNRTMTKQYKESCLTFDAKARFNERERTEDFKKKWQTFDAKARFYTRERTDKFKSEYQTFDATANYRWYKDNLGKERKTFGTTADFKWKQDNLTKEDKTVDVEVHYKTSKDVLTAAQKTVNTTAEFVKRTLGNAFSTVFGSEANFNKRTTDTTRFSTVFGSEAKFESRSLDASKFSTEFDSEAHFTTRTRSDNFKAKWQTFDATANFSTRTRTADFKSKWQTFDSTANFKYRSDDISTTFDSTAFINKYTIDNSIKDGDNIQLDATVNITKTTGGVKGTIQYDTEGTVWGNALGGAFYGGNWHSIPQYASGGAPHGSLFVAGEAGAELVGHIGGRTEVLNQSQIAASIAAGVHRTLSASGVRAGGSYSLADGSNEDVLYRAFRRALDETDFGGDVELDGDTIYRAMVRRNRANTRLTGVNAMA